MDIPSEAHRCSSSSQSPHGLIPSLKPTPLPTMSSSTAQVPTTSAFSSDLAVEFCNDMGCIRILVTDMRWIPRAEVWRRKQTVVQIPTAGAKRNDQISEVWPIFQVIKSLEMSKYWADKVTRNISEMAGHDRLVEPPDIWHTQIESISLGSRLASKPITVSHWANTIYCFTEGQGTHLSLAPALAFQMHTEPITEGGWGRGGESILVKGLPCCLASKNAWIWFPTLMGKVCWCTLEIPRILKAETDRFLELSCQLA